MATGEGVLLEVRLEAEGLGGMLQIPSALRPVPGQYLTASTADPFDTLAAALFPSQIAGDMLALTPPLPTAWTAGMRLKLRGPLGRGFRLPVGARRVALASLEASPLRLLPLAHLALERGCAVALYACSTPRNLPEEVEVLPPDLLPEAPAWADFLALEASTTGFAGLRSRLGLHPHQRPACETQVLVRAPMACTGLADCGVCAVPTRQGWAMACSDGPVFDFLQIEG